MTRGCLSPVANAYLNMFYSSVLPTIAKSAKTLPTTSIDIGVPHPGFLRVRAENYIHESVAHIFADSVDAGVNEVIWDSRDDAGRYLYSDCYWVYATLDDTLLSTHKLPLLTYQHDETNPAPFLKTNGLGRFSIAYSRLPLTEKFIITTDANNGTYNEVTIGPTDQIYAFTSTDYGVAEVSYANPRELKIVLNHKK